MKIPFVDLKAQYHSIKSEIDEAIAAVMADTAFVGGSSNKYVTGFEKDFAQWLNMKHFVACANGTDSIEILLEAFAIGHADEVIVPALTWISTSEAVGRIGAKPVFVDVKKDTLLIDLDQLESKINSKTKAIIPVHLYGNTVNMERVMEIANKHKLVVIEDCAQSHGSKFNGKLSGTFGHAASFSFYPGKNLGAYGDAGGIATNDSALAEKCRMIANHGQLQKHKHLIEGRNSRMDGIHGAVLAVKLRYLGKWNDRRIENARHYDAHLNTASLQLPVVNKNASHVYHLYVVRSKNRDEMKRKLEEMQIECAIHYPTALPFLDAYKKFNHKPEDFPVAVSETQKILSIPMFPELTESQIQRVSSVINSFAVETA